MMPLTGWKSLSKSSPRNIWQTNITLEARLRDAAALGSRRKRDLPERRNPVASEGAARDRPRRFSTRYSVRSS